MKKNKILIFIATYNENLNISNLFESILNIRDNNDEKTFHYF